MPDFGINLTRNLCRISVLSPRADAWILSNVPNEAIAAQPRYPELLIIPIPNHAAILHQIESDGLDYELIDDLPVHA